MPDLFGIQIPPGAVTVEVRPIFGKGGTRLLFRGPVEENGVFVSEADIADRVAKDAGFWEYVDSAVEAGRIPESKGIWAFKLSLQFANQDGSYASDASTGRSSYLTGEPVEFWRAKGAKAGGESAVVIELLKLVREQGQLVPQLVREAVREGLTAGKELLCASAREAAQLQAAGSAPLAQAMTLIQGFANAETKRADDASRAVVRMLNETKQDTDDDIFDKATKIGGLVLMAKKVKDTFGSN